MNPSAGKRHSGVVTWFDWRKGFGFIRPDEEATGEDGEIFVSHEEIERDGFKTLEAGERVAYDLQPGEGGRKAARVSLL